MKKKYCIGFFVVLFVFVSLLGIGYQVSYQYVMDRQMARQQDKQQRSVAVKGEAEKNEGYYLAELHGYVVVYLSDLHPEAVQWGIKVVEGRQRIYQDRKSTRLNSSHLV